MHFRLLLEEQAGGHLLFTLHPTSYRPTDQTPVVVGIGGSFGFAQMSLGHFRSNISKSVDAHGFFAAVAVTLAPGIGGTASAFSIVCPLLLRPLPYTNPQELVRVFPSRLRTTKPTKAIFS